VVRANGIPVVNLHRDLSSVIGETIVTFVIASHHWCGNREILEGDAIMNDSVSEQSPQGRPATTPIQHASAGSPVSETSEQDAVWDTVDEASLESFPCSDAPAWTLPDRPAGQPTKQQT
jgi:hypothetical protein